MRRLPATVEGVSGLAERLPRARLVLRLVLVGFVLAWLFGPYALTSAVPIWIVFVVAVYTLPRGIAGLGRSPAKKSTVGSAESPATEPRLAAEPAGRQ